MYIKMNETVEELVENLINQKVKENKLRVVRRALTDKGMLEEDQFKIINCSLDKGILDIEVRK